MAKKQSSSIPPAHGFKVLSEYELGKCSEAIPAVAIRGKPITEVMMRRADEADLRADLKKLLLRSGFKSQKVRFWIRETEEGRIRYGFYREEWAVKALDFLHKATLSAHDHAWISGLLFGITATEIQRFINTKI